MKSKKTTQETPKFPYSLRSIYLRDCTTWMDKGFDPLLPGQDLSAVFRTGEGRVDCRESTMKVNDGETKIHSCTFTTRFDFAYSKVTESNTPQSDDDIEKAFVVKITAEVSVDYIINTPDFPDAEMLHRWGNSNVMLHLWPYWREFCHSTMLRMGLPVTMIPLIQFSAGPDLAQQERSDNSTLSSEKSVPVVKARRASGSRRIIGHKVAP